MKNKISSQSKLLGIFILLCILSSCEKMIEVDPPITTTNGDNLYNDDVQATAVLTGIYASLSNIEASSISVLGLPSISFYSGLSADELALHGSGQGIDKPFLFFYRNSININTPRGNLWTPLYADVFVINSAIQGLNSSQSLTSAVKQQLLGEAYFLRGLYYFYLVNLYGKVPLALTTDYKVTSLLPRSDINVVYDQIITDLKEAQSLLNDKFTDATLLIPTEERVRPTKWAATALLARGYLYNKDWVNAEAQATALIENSLQFGLNGIDDVFIKNSTESIWQLQPVRIGRNTPEAWAFILPANGPSSSRPAYLSDTLYNSFETGDMRKAKWVNSVTIGIDTYHYSFKYKSATLGDPVNEYSTVLRLAEQYLIRSEARAQLNNIDGAQDDLNTIRNRAGLSPTAASNKEGLLSVILNERKVELFTEWGHRWLDLKRTGNIDIVMTAITAIKGGVWNSYQQLYPIPQSEMVYNPNVRQNDGY